MSNRTVPVGHFYFVHIDHSEHHIHLLRCQNNRNNWDIFIIECSVGMWLYIVKGLYIRRQNCRLIGAILCRYCHILFNAGHVQITNVYSGSLIRVHSLVRLQVEILTYGARIALYSCERYASVQHTSTYGHTQYRYFSFAEFTKPSHCGSHVYCVLYSK